MLSTFLVAIREGLEGSLIIGILIAYAIRSNRRSLVAPIWLGVSMALIGSFGFGAFLTYTSNELSDQAELLFAGTTSLVSVALVTWMVFWMKRSARNLKSELHGKMEEAQSMGRAAIIGAAFFAVAREGLETALFVYANFKTVTNDSAPSVGLILGLATAVLLGILIYRQSIKLNLSKFFTITGVALVVVAAGVLSYGIHELQEFGALPGPDALAWNVSDYIAKESIAGSILAGTIGFQPKTSWLQLFAWLAYLGVVIPLYLRPAQKLVSKNSLTPVK